MLPPLPKAILFDLDDTILAWSDTIEPAWKNLCARFAPEITVAGTENLYRFVARSFTGLRESGERHPESGDPNGGIIRWIFAILRAENPALAEEIAQAHPLERLELIRPFPGALESLRHLRDAGVRLALLTSGGGDFQRKKVDKFDLDTLFNCILIEGELGFGKPDERIYRLALTELDAKPRDTWMVGDSLEWDLETAQRLGMTGIWVVWPASKYVEMQGLPPEELPENSHVRPERVIRRISELVE